MAVGFQSESIIRIRFTPNASADIGEVYDYIAVDNPVTAQRVLDQIESMIDHLVDHPSLGHHGRVSNTRELVIPNTPYIVAYELSPGFVDILAIIHSSRRWPEKFS